MSFSKQFSLSPDDWLIYEKGFKPSKVRYYESLFTLGNGYLGQRACLEENPVGSYRGTYIAGIFDKSESFVPQLVKFPGWNDFSVWIGKHKFNFDDKILFHERVLDLKKGILHRKTRFKDEHDRILLIETKRVIFAHQVRGALLEIAITAENFSEEIKVISGLSGDVTNAGYHPEERIKHLNLVEIDTSKNYLYMEVETRDNKTKIALATETKFLNPPLKFIKVNRMYGEKCAEHIIFKPEKEKKYRFTKWTSIYTSREGYKKQLKSATLATLDDLRQEGIEFHLQKHIKFREEQWQKCDISLKGDPKAQLGIRFNLYHLLIAKPHHDPTISIGARFLTGEGYKGHTFWDTEIFMLPFYIYTFPEDARNLLLYRYYTLNGAMQNAKNMGYNGAKFAWESADSGIETTPQKTPTPDGKEIKIWTGDEEHHIVSDVVYGIYKYFEATQDKEFLYNQGAEIIFQTARFWLSRVEKRRGRFEIRKLIGPDELHEHVDNNAFTNFLVKWHLGRAVKLYHDLKNDKPSQFKKIIKHIRIKLEEIKKMKAISKEMYMPFDKKSGLIEQFEGYFSLADPPLKSSEKGFPKFPKDLDNTELNRIKLIKQADVVLLLCLFIDKFTPQIKKKNYEYYEARTLHMSSLSLCAYALMGLEVGDHKKAYNYFIKTSYIDLADLAGNTDHGIHAAATGGAWQMLIHGFAGMKTYGHILNFNPWLPKRWQELSYKFLWQNCLFDVEINHKNITFKMDSPKPKTIEIKVQGNPITLKPGKLVKVRLK